MLSIAGYKIIKILDSGSAGSVYLALHIPTNQTVAIKQLFLEFCSWDACTKLKEVEVLRSLSHPNIIKLREARQIGKKLCLVFSYGGANLLNFYTKIKEKVNFCFIRENFFKNLKFGRQSANLLSLSNICILKTIFTEISNQKTY